MKEFAGIFSIVASLATFLFGGFDVTLQILSVFIVCDFITGLLKGWYTGSLSSQQGYKGIIKKAGIMFVIIVANMLDILTGTPLFRMPVVYFFVAIEGVSILENLGKIGVPIPEVLLDKLAQLKANGNAGQEDEKTPKQ